MSHDQSVCSALSHSPTPCPPRTPPVGHAASASGSGSSGNQFPKVSNGATYLLNQFQFKNKDDMNAFADSYLNGAQGYMRAGGCTQHAFEGTTPNCLISFFSFDNTGVGSGLTTVLVTVRGRVAERFVIPRAALLPAPWSSAGERTCCSTTHAHTPLCAILAKNSV